MLLLKSALFKRTYSPVFTLRLCQTLDRQRWRNAFLPVARLLHRWAIARASIDLPWQTRVGPGFRIVHGFGLVVNVNACIGRNVTVFHGVTIGQRDRLDGLKMETSYPEIADDVFIGSYAQVIGSSIGPGAVIAPMSVVIDEVKERTVVGGNPARFIKHVTRSYVSKPWPGSDEAPADALAAMEASPATGLRSEGLAR